MLYRHLKYYFKWRHDPIMLKNPMADPTIFLPPAKAIGKFLVDQKDYCMYWAEMLSSIGSTVLAINSMLVLSTPSFEVYFCERSLPTT